MKKLTKQATELLGDTVSITQNKKDLMNEARTLIQQITKEIEDTGFEGKVSIEIDVDQAYAEIEALGKKAPHKIRMISFRSGEGISAGFSCSTSMKVVSALSLSPLNMAVFMDHFLEILTKIKEEEERDLSLLATSVNRLWDTFGE